MSFRRLSFFLLALLLSVVSFPQGTQKSYKILGISVEGNKSTDATTIIANSGLRVGSEIQVPGDQTLNAIRQLWTLNIFSDVQIIIDREIEEGASFNPSNPDTKVKWCRFWYHRSACTSSLPAATPALLSPSAT